MGHDGYFSPDTVSWRIHRDASAILGAGRALLIQALDPNVMAVFMANSDYRDDPWGRLRRTGSYFGDVIFGDRERAEAAAGKVRALHRRLVGVPDETGRVRRADDPDLLLWVHAVAVDSFLTAYRQYTGLLTRRDANTYIAEQVVAAELIGVDPGDVPANEADLRDYMDGVTGLRLTEGAREGMHMILFEPPIPELLRPAWMVVAVAIIATLPPEVRHLYGLRWTPAADLPVRVSVFGACRAFNAWNRARPLVQNLRKLL